MKKQSDKIQNTLYAAIIATELSHVFCCVLPTIFSVLSILAGLGVVGVVPVWLKEAHELLHNWEIPIILTSGVVITLGWFLHHYFNKVDCHDHGPCIQKKKISKHILTIATALFVINVSVFVVFHKGMGIYTSKIVEETHKAHNHP